MGGKREKNNNLQQELHLIDHFGLFSLILIFFLWGREGVTCISFIFIFSFGFNKQNCSSLVRQRLLEIYHWNRAGGKHFSLSLSVHCVDIT